MKKKIMAVLLACALAIGTAAGSAGTVTALAEESRTVAGEFEYSDNGGIAITKYVGNGTEVTVPGSINGKKVMSIFPYAFSESNVKSVVVQGVNIIGKTAFAGCSGLESVSISEGTFIVEEAAFGGCSKLESVSIPASVTRIGHNAFRDTPWLEEQLRKGDGLAIANHKLVGAQEDLSGDLIIPEGVDVIGDSAFSGHAGLESVSIPDSVTKIGIDAFNGCSGLKSVSIPGGASIETGAFSGCGGLENVNFSEGVKFITGFGSRYYRLKSVSIPVSVTYINPNSFEDCDNLKDVYYAGSPEQWGKITIGERNESLLSANIHYNSVSAENPGPENPGDSGTENPGKPGQGSDSGALPAQKLAQSVTANDNMIKTYGAKAFSLGAKSSGGTTLSYEVSDLKVATVDASGYIIQCATDKKFKKNKAQAEVSKNKTLFKTMKNLKGGKRYYVRVCAYAKSGNRKIQGDWSKAKTVKVKK